MKFLSPTEKQIRFTPLVISVSYALISASWVILTDYILADYISSPTLLTHYQTIKGWFFILSTAMLLYYFIKKSFLKIESSTQALIKSENKYRTLLEQASDTILLMDELGNIIDSNSRAGELLGYSAEEFKKLSIKDLIPPDELEKYPLKFKELYSGSIVLLERKMLQKTGKLLFVEISAKMPDGNTIIAIIRDITARKKIEDELRSSEEQYRLLFRENPNPMWVYDAITLGFLAVNETAVSKYGYSREEFLSMNIKDIRPREDIPALEENVQNTLFEDYQRTGPWMHQKKNGEVIFVEIISNSIIFAGKAARIVIANDITERKLANEALQISEKRYRSLFEKSPISIWEEDLSLIKSHIDLLKKTGIKDFRKYLETYPDEIINSLEMLRLLDVNEATLELFQASSKEELFSNFSRIAEYANYRIQKEAIIAISERTTRFELEIEGKTLMGRTKYLYVRWSVAEGFEDNYGRVLLTIVDITERKSAEEALKISNQELNKLNEELEERVRNRTAQLEAANKELETFSVSVSHDLKAPLRAIDGFSQILLDDYSPQFNGEVKKFLNIISKNAAQMEQLISDILSFSRIYNREKNEVLLDMKSIAQEAVNTLLRENEDRVISAEVNDLPQVKGDRSMLQKVWLNLISNAFKFTRYQQKAEILIGGYSDQNQAYYYVKDNGVGFDMEYAHNLFGVFQRLHPSADFEGTGVGLAIVRRIISRHDGRVWAEAEVNKGATFFFSLPLNKGI